MDLFGCPTGRNSSRNVILDQPRAGRVPPLPTGDALSLISSLKYDRVFRMNRRQAILRFCQFLAASPLLKADRKYSELSDPLLKLANVFDFARLAKAKVD